mgnify:FL=1
MSLERFMLTLRAFVTEHNIRVNTQSNEQAVSDPSDTI